MFHYKLQQNDKKHLKNGEYVSILITMKQQQFRNYNARYIEDAMMSILET